MQPFYFIHEHVIILPFLQSQKLTVLISENESEKLKNCLTPKILSSFPF